MLLFFLSAILVDNLSIISIQFISFKQESKTNTLGLISRYFSKVVIPSTVSITSNLLSFARFLQSFIYLLKEKHCRSPPLINSNKTELIGGKRNAR